MSRTGLFALVLVLASASASAPGAQAQAPMEGSVEARLQRPLEAAVEAPAWSPEEEDALRLLRSLRKKERPSDVELAARLSRAGTRVLPLLFEIEASRRVPAPGAGEAQILSEVQEHAILLACAQLERSPVLAHVDAALQGASELSRRIAAVALIGAVGRANDLPQTFGLALAGEESVLDERMAKTLRRAVSAILGRDPRAMEQLVALRRITRPELQATLVEAVGEAGDPRGLAYLSEVAYWSEAMVLDVMGQVARLGPSGDEAIDTAMRVRARAYLDEDRPGHCRAAITALAALGDLDAIAPLIALLGGDNPGLRENAHWALRRLTGLTMAASPENWARWHQAEQYWLLREKTREFQRLRLADPAEVADALRTILTHPLARTELAAALPDLLKSPWPYLRVLACRTLGELSSKEAVGRLVWALEDPEAEVVAAAHAALRRLTQLDLPREALAWQAATHTEPRGTRL